jgi:hypothetical protein
MTNCHFTSNMLIFIYISGKVKDVWSCTSTLYPIFLLGMERKNFKYPPCTRMYLNSMEWQPNFNSGVFYWYVISKEKCILMCNMHGWIRSTQVPNFTRIDLMILTLLPLNWQLKKILTQTLCYYFIFYKHTTFTQSYTFCHTVLPYIVSGPKRGCNEGCYHLKSFHIYHIVITDCRKLTLWHHVMLKTPNVTEPLLNSSLLQNTTDI